MGVLPSFSSPGDIYGAGKTVDWIDADVQVDLL